MAQIRGTSATQHSIVNQEVLRRLHRIHRQLSDLRDRLARGPRQVKVREANVAKLSAEVDKTKADVKAARVSSDQKQLQLKSGEAKIKDLQGKLNASSTNREYQALRDQIAADEMANSVLSDEILEAMERIDELAVVVKEAEQNLAKGKEELGKAEQSVRELDGLLGGDVRRLEAELAQTETELPEDVRGVYSRLVKTLASEALAAVEGGNCGGCHQTITANLTSQLLMSRVVLCHSCGRILYMPESQT